MLTILPYYQVNVHQRMWAGGGGQSPSWDLEVCHLQAFLILSFPVCQTGRGKGDVTLLRLLHRVFVRTYWENAVGSVVQITEVQAVLCSLWHRAGIYYRFNFRFVIFYLPGFSIIYWLPQQGPRLEANNHSNKKLDLEFWSKLHRPSNAASMSIWAAAVNPLYGSSPNVQVLQEVPTGSSDHLTGVSSTLTLRRLIHRWLWPGRIEVHSRAPNFLLGCGREEESWF